jgi:hypothetical protein
MSSYLIVILAIANFSLAEKKLNDAKAFHRRMVMYRRLASAISRDRFFRNYKEKIRTEINSQLAELENEDVFTSELLKQENVNLH